MREKNDHEFYGIELASASSELQDLVFTFIESLEKDKRTAVVLRQLDRLTVEETAQAMDMTVEQVVVWEEDAFRELLADAPRSHINDAIEALKGTPAPRIETREVIESIARLSPQLIFHLRRHHEKIDLISPEVFENLIAEFLAQRGFEDVRLVAKSPMTSADIYAAHRIDAIGSTIRYFVEVKRIKGAIGIEVINAVYGAMLIERKDHGWNAAMIVSSNKFSKFKKTTVRDLELRGLVLRDRDDVLAWLEEYEPHPTGLWLPKG